MTDAPNVYVAPPLHKRILYALIVFILQKLVIGPATALRRLREARNPPETYPTLIRVYNSRRHLPLRIFFPKSYDRSAPRASALVISLNYAKAPANPFPGQTADIVALFDAVLADAELLPHIDLSRVGMMGFSARGTLALTASATPTVRGRLTAGVVPVYPIVDFSIPRPEKAKTRRYKPALGGVRGATEDSLNGIAPAFGWAYLPDGQDLRDPRLSPSFNDRKDFPRRIWFVGCELDVLGHETWRMACHFAGKREPGMDEPIGQQDLADEGARGAMIVEGDERFAWEVKNEEGEVKWLCVADAAHGFDSAEMMGADEETIQDGLMKRDKLITMTGKWLFG